MKNAVQSLDKHHRFVHFMRILLMGLACLVFILLFVWPQVTKRADWFSRVLKDSVTTQNLQAKVDMTKVQFFSEDEKGQPFTVTSDYITEIDHQNSLVQLDNPEGKITLSSGVILSSKSPIALFNQENQVVHFKQGVNVFSDNGYTAQMLDVFVDYKNQISYSNHALKLRGERINLDSSGFVVRKNGEEMDLSGPVRVELKDTHHVVITADENMKIRQKTQTITAVNDVLVDDGVNKLSCNILTAYFTKTGKNQYVLRAIQAQKNVKIKTLNEEITGNDAYYNLQTEKAFITGQVVVKKEQGIMYGDKATIDMKLGTSQLETNQDAQQKTRVKGTILPVKLKKKE